MARGNQRDKAREANLKKQAGEVSKKPPHGETAGPPIRFPSLLPTPSPAELNHLHIRVRVVVPIAYHRLSRLRR